MSVPTLGRIDPFDVQSEDWVQYTERLEQFFVANGIEDNGKKVAVLLTVIGAKAYALLRNLVSPTKPSEKSYADLVKVLKDHLKPKPLVIAERFKFHRRNQRDGETIAQYVAELRNLSEQCDFKDYLEEALRDRFVCGLRSETIQRRLLVEENLTLQKAYELAHGLETASRKASELQASTKVLPEGIQRMTPLKSGRGGATRICHRCGKPGHSPDSCYFRAQRCRACGKPGHIAKMYKSPESETPPKSANRQENETPPKAANRRQFFGRRPGGYRGRTSFVDHAETTEEGEVPAAVDEPDALFMVRTVRNNPESPITVEPEVAGVPLRMEVDTGASVTIISEKTWQEVFPQTVLEKSDTLLKTYTGERLQVLGKMQVLVRYNSQEQRLPLLVVSGNGPSLFGRNWLSAIRLDWAQVRQVRTALASLLDKYSEIFRDELGTLKGVEARLELQQDAVPKFHRARSVPYAIRGAIEKDLERMENLGVLEKVAFSDWASPIVPVPKADGTIRICGDYKVTINPVLHVNQHPIPKAEDLFATLAGGQRFSKIDLSQAYQQILLTPDSQKLVTINTHRGLYRYNRLPFGVASAPAVFQEAMEKVLQGIPKVVVYIDDILVTGSTDDEHLQVLEEVLRRLQEYGLRVKKAKCFFLRSSVEYLGHIVDAEGLHAAPSKVEAMTKAPEPKNVQELRSFLGLANYYAKFIRHMSTITQPLNRLLGKSVPWKWTPACRNAFQELKRQLASTEVLVHYDPDLPVKLDGDASPYGVGAVLSHVYPNGDERPIAYASRTLSQSERGYAQLEKEALSLIFGVKKFHHFLYGRRFTLVTDHKPLETILGPKKSLPTLAAARLQRWALLLANYQYDIQYRSTKQHSNADGLSRLPLQEIDPTENVSAVSVLNLSQIDFLPVDANHLRRATSSDPVLSKVIAYTQRGWPTQVSEELKPFAHRQNELTVEAGCLLWGMRVVVPKACQEAVLTELHTSHQGIVRMKSLARLHVWWPLIDKQIEQVARSCESCQGVRNRPPAALLHPWSWPDRPWMRIHVDFAGPFLGSMFMVIVDAHSKWLEVIPMKSTTAEKTIEVLRGLFASHGLPEQLVSDNGPQFTATEFEHWMKANGVKHIKTSPYHPSSNGEAERFVQTLKQALRAGKNDSGSLNLKLNRFLLTYRSTPTATTGVSPAELFLKRPLRTRLDLLRPSIPTRVLARQAAQKQVHDAHSKLRLFDVGQAVLVRNLREGPKWLRGTVVEQTGPVSYRVQMENHQVWRRHVDQLLDLSLAAEAPELTDHPGQTVDADLCLPPELLPTETGPPERPEPSEPREPTGANGSPPVVDTSASSLSQSVRYPSREHKPPERLEPKF